MTSLLLSALVSAQFGPAPPDQLRCKFDIPPLPPRQVFPAPKDILKEVGFDIDNEIKDAEALLAFMKKHEFPQDTVSLIETQIQSLHRFKEKLK